jgi:hypothetical protein
MGLTCRREDQAYVFQCDGRDQDQLRLIKGPKKEIAWMTWATHQKGYVQILKTSRIQRLIFNTPMRAQAQTLQPSKAFGCVTQMACC